MIWLLFSSFVEAATLRVSEGFLQGESNGKIESFLGVPYGAPPVGNLRWRAPRAPLPWQGVRKATSFGESCPQVGGLLSVTDPELFGKAVGSEDCLHLNLWKPKGDKLRPLVVWIHGGSNTKGHSADPLYDGARLAEEADVVVATINYRLGALGALSLPLLREGNPLDDSGNFTTLDIIAALNWLRANGDALGIDPHSVTVMGQSAGCMNVWGLLRSPLAKERFSRAVCLSGLPNAYPRSLAERKSKQRAEGWLKEMGVRSSLADLVKERGIPWVRNFLRTLPWQILVKNPPLVPIQHISDGVVLPEAGLEGLATGGFHRVPMILGNTADEASYFILLGSGELSEKDLWRLANSPDAKRSDLVNPLHFPAFVTAVEKSNIDMELTARALANQLAGYTKVYRTVFEWKNMPEPWLSVLGAFHGLDIALLFGNFPASPHSMAFAWSPTNESDRERLHREMIMDLKPFFYGKEPGGSEKSWPLWGIRQEAYVFQ